jgi:hypothetical protein
LPFPRSIVISMHQLYLKNDTNSRKITIPT